jgi:hypothetical protein
MISGFAEAHLSHEQRHSITPSVMSKVESSSSNPQKEEAIPGLGVLEEDDEFEEFPVQGKHPSRPEPPDLCLTRLPPLDLLVAVPQILQTGTIHRQISLTWRVPGLQDRQSEVINCGKITGTTMTSRRSSASS